MNIFKNKILSYDISINDEPIKLYCGRCLSHNMKIYEGIGIWDSIVCQNDKMECLDCGFKGETKVHKLLSEKMRNKLIFGITRINKIKKIKNKYENRRIG